MYIVGKFLQEHKLVHSGLKEIFGIGSSLSSQLCAFIGVNKSCSIKNLSTPQVSKLIFLLEIWSISNKNLTEDMLKRSFNLAISDLLLMNNFRGSRHAKKLPCRGQRTKTNSRNSRKMRRKI